MAADQVGPMLRITAVEETPEQAVLKVEGWLSEGAVALLELEGRRHLDQRRRLVLDLSGVHFIDEEGLGLLEGWAGARLELRGGSLFIRTQLQSRGLGEGPD